MNTIDRFAEELANSRPGERVQDIGARIGLKPDYSRVLLQRIIKRLGPWAADIPEGPRA